MTEKTKLFCLIRQSWVTGTPEEKVRQKLLLYLTQELGYPRAHITVEKELKKIPHLVNSPLEIPNRRADIICFGKDIHPEYSLFPFLMIECKAIPLTTKVIHQVMGYNHSVKAKYIAVANQNELHVGEQHPSGQYTFTDMLPRYC